MPVPHVYAKPLLLYCFVLFVVSSIVIVLASAFTDDVSSVACKPTDLAVLLNDATVD